jgi:hypothetical protein
MFPNLHKRKRLSKLHDTAPLTSLGLSYYTVRNYNVTIAMEIHTQ